MGDDKLLSETDACRACGLTASGGHRQWLRKLAQPIITTDAAGHTCRRYRKADLEQAAVRIAQGLTINSYNRRHE
jgi:hypothetical protein